MKKFSAFRTENTTLNEGLSFRMDPPNILVLKRKAIRIFPDGTKVALYHAEKINKYVSIPYSDLEGKNIIQVHEQQEAQDLRGNITELEKIAQSGQDGLLTFNDGKQQKVDAMTAKAIVNIYNMLNSLNRSKIEIMVNKDVNNFAKVASFAHGVQTVGN